MKKIELLRGIFDGKVFLVTFAASPILVFLHECVHFSLFSFYGFVPYFKSFSMTAIRGFEYSFKGLVDALTFYNASPTSIGYAVLYAPVFSLIVSYVFLYLFVRKGSAVYFGLAFSPLCVRMLALTVMLPSTLSGTRATDEAVTARFLGLPLVPVVLVSLLLGYLCLVLLAWFAPRAKRLPFVLSALSGGFLGYGLAEVLSLLFAHG